MRAANLPKRQAYTLMEIVCVVAIIAAAAAMSVPVWQTMLTDARMTAAGDQVRARLADARSKAMEQGVPWKFAYIPGTGVYQLAPEDSQDWSSTDTTPTRTDVLIRDELPKDVVFGMNQSDIQNASEGGSSAGGAGWQTIGVYLYAGDARDDVTTYFGKPGLMPMRVRLRGMTGVVTIEVPREVKDQP